jgi:hypothetical protein
MQRMERTIAGGGGGVHAILGTHGDVGRGAGVARGGRFGGDLVAFHFEEMHAGIQGFADEQFEGALRGFQFATLVFQLLDALEQLAAGAFPDGDRPRLHHR